MHMNIYETYIFRSQTTTLIVNQWMAMLSSNCWEAHIMARHVCSHFALNQQCLSLSWWCW